MPYKKITGIYKILNIKNNKLYVGSALSVYSRLNTHKRLLNNKKHPNSHLQKSWEKYGLENFIFEIIEECDVNLLQEREEYYIKHYQANNNKFGYNKRINCKTNLGLKYSDEHKKNLSLAHMGIKRTEEAHKKIVQSQYKKVYKYDLDGNFLMEYDSVQSAGKECEAHPANISMCARGIIKKTKNFIWSYEKVDKINVIKKKVLQFTKNGEFVKEWENAINAVKFYKCIWLYNCLKDNSKNCVGFKWKYK